MIRFITIYTRDPIRYATRYTILNIRILSTTVVCAWRSNDLQAEQVMVSCVVCWISWCNFLCKIIVLRNLQLSLITYLAWSIGGLTFIYRRWSSPESGVYIIDICQLNPNNATRQTGVCHCGLSSRLIAGSLGRFSLLNFFSLDAMIYSNRVRRHHWAVTDGSSQWFFHVCCMFCIL